MTERILDISSQPAALRVKHEQLVVHTDDIEQSIPLAEIAALIVSHPAVTYTQGVVSGLMNAGAAFIACDARHMPSGMMLPVEGHHLQAERVGKQIAASLPLRKRVWQQIVREKIRSQGRLLKRIHGNDKGLAALADRVQSGDPKNVEAQAARRYWPALFGGAEFRRNREAPGRNAALNYGYTVLRATVGRAIAGAGLHPSIGVHHHNRYDAFCLADDLMEPYRVLVDGAVAADERFDGPLAPTGKRVLVVALMGPHPAGEEMRSLFDCVAATAVSLVKVFEGARKGLAFPALE